MTKILNAVAYTRFSSDLQREESIEAQVRAITEYAERNGYALLKTYADRGISGTTDNRPEFQAMIEAVKGGGIDAVIVHKYDRFARNRADSAIYRRELEKRGVKLLSVLENFDDSPESIILQSVIEGYNEYYSKNLRREVMKGLKENALSCRTTGGVPCLGYSVDKNTMKFLINEWEAEAVKLIFKRYLQGEGYPSIINELNEKGYKTKRGASFGKNSLYEILRNEKYTGVYTYNVSASKNAEGKANRHKRKPDEEIIRVEGGIPQIISKDDFEKVQEIMKRRKHDKAKFKAKQEYLLSGLITCGECGSKYAGNARNPSPSNALYISYRCVKKNGKIKCRNPEIKRDLIEATVLKKLADKVFNEEMLTEIILRYNDYAASRNTELISSIKNIKIKLSETERKIENIVNVIVQTGSAALSEKLKELEKDKATLTQSIAKKEKEAAQMSVSKQTLKKAFAKAKQMLESGTLANKKSIVQNYVKNVTMYKDKIVVEFNITNNYTITEEIDRNELKKSAGKYDMPINHLDNNYRQISSH